MCNAEEVTRQAAALSSGIERAGVRETQKSEPLTTRLTERVRYERRVRQRP